MLWWLAAAAAPLLIHLLSRRRYREVPWAAAEYLLAAMQQSSRRLRAEQWLLLAIRTATIVCIVIAVAGPYLERLGGATAAGQPLHKILVIDGSFSMAYKPGDASRFEQAKQLARDIVARSSQGDGFSLVLMTAPARTIVGSPALVSDETRTMLDRLKRTSGQNLSPEEDLKLADDDFLREIHDLKLPHGGGDLAGALDRVNEIIAAGHKEYPRFGAAEVYFITDLGRTSWDSSKVAGGRAMSKQLLKLAGSTRLTVVDVGQEHSENLAVVGLGSPQRIFTTKAPVELATQVRNFGDQAHHARVELSVDGQRAQERTIDLEPQARQTVTFTHQFDAPGDHAIEATLSGDASDSLEIDNHRWLSLSVKQALETLIVNGEGSREHARYLLNALDPYRDGSASLPVHVEQIADGGLLEVELRRFDCIILSNVGQFTPAEGRLLADYVQSGGGLVAFLGDRVDPQNYNLELGGGREKTPRLLPAQLDRPADLGHYSFDPLGYKDLMVHEFQGNERAGLLTTGVSRYFRLKAWKNAKQTPPPALAIRETGDPAIVGQQAEGKRPGEVGGRVILVALPASFAAIDPISKEPWSNWPIKNSFPPVVQNLLIAAVNSSIAERNVLVGKPLESALPKAQASNMLTVDDPGRGKQQIRVAAREDGNRWSYPSTWLSGIYRAQFGGDQQPQLFAVNVDTAESDLAKLDPRELPEQISVVPAWSDLDQRPAASIGARAGEHRWYLCAALVLLLTETVVTWWFGYRAS